jgi:hypothetical protein
VNVTQRVSSDTTDTVRATVIRSGATDHPCIEIPADDADAFPSEEVVRFVIDEREYRANIERPLTGDELLVRGAYDTPRLARNPGEGENRLVKWFEGSNREFDQSILLDVIEEGFQYGLREPGDRAVYSAAEAPDESLASIAEGTED